MLQRFHSKNKDRTIKNGVYEIRSGVNNQYILDVLDGSKSNGANIQLLQDASADKQRFMVSYEGYGYYTIVAFHSKKAIGCKKSTTDTNVFQYDLNNTDTERWMIKSVGNGYYNIISKQTNLYLESKGSQVANNTNIQTGSKNNSANQKFKFEFIEDIIKDEKGSKTIEDGIYEIHLSSNTKYTLDVYKVSQLNKANVQLWVDSDVDEQRFKITYQGDGYYTIMALHSKKLVEVTTGQRVTGVNVQQYESNGSDDQKWIIKKISNGKYSFISKASGLYMEAASSSIQNGTNIQVGRYSDSDLQRFSLNLVANVVSMDTNKYPGYQEKINALAKEHPNWKFELLYTGLKYSNVIAGETAVHSRNLVPTDYEGEWICPTCGKKLYDSGWYCASSKAVAYYMDPRNFLDETYIFQFVDVNSFNSSISLSAIQDQVDGTFLEDYASDIRNACQRTGVNPFYIISRLIQEQGRKGTRIGTGMDGGDGKTYYNPFNIGASGNGSSAIYANALAKAKANGWDTMEKAIEGGIGFCKKNWLDNYQNTLYQNKFDIDDRNGTALYNHQYMQNLMAACSEGKLLQGMYRNTDLLDSKITFIIPVYEEMTKDSYPIPKSDSETYPMDIESTAGDLRIREEPNTDCEILRIVPNKGTKLLSLQRGINSNWQKVITKDGLIGYVSGSYVKQINDITTCNYNAIVKTNDGDGCNIRIGPSTRVSKITALADNTQVTVIDDSTYKGIDGYDWSRIIVKSTGIQAFIPSRYLSKN